MLIELVNKHNFDCICLQETIKSNFRQRDLDRFAGTKDMFWSWVPCSGHSGGMLMGVDKELATVTAENKGVFFQSCTMTMKEDGFSWTLMNIYGPAHDDRKLEFLEAIQNEILDSDVPIVLGGDFNLVRRVEEKSSGNVDVRLMDAFNDMINISNLRELFRSGSGYTWSNKQNPPIMCVLDRVLVSTSWEDKFNLASLVTGPRIGSDHNPLMLDTGDSLRLQQFYFRFSAHWLTQDGFKEWVQSKWPARVKADPLDHWHIVSSKLRRAIKGWGQNKDSQQKKEKYSILSRIKLLDEWSNSRPLAPIEWNERYELDKELQKILEDEEIQWQKRSGEKWILDGDSNTSYFHKCANGRRRKMQIKMLEIDGEEIVEDTILKTHITECYKQLFGSEDVADMHLDAHLWPRELRVQQADNEFLTRPFSLEEIDVTIKEMKNNTAPGPDGFTVEFFKAFWPLIRGDIKQMLDNLHAAI